MLFIVIEGMNPTGTNVVDCYCCFVMHYLFVGNFATMVILSLKGYFSLVMVPSLRCGVQCLPTQVRQIKCGKFAPTKFFAQVGYIPFSSEIPYTSMHVLYYT
jgi:hypothetical protein